MDERALNSAPVVQRQPLSFLERASCQTDTAHRDAFSAPTGVILPTGPVVPDLVYFHMRNLHILTEKRIVGVPDLLIEIASPGTAGDRKSTRLNSSHANISYAVFCLKKKKISIKHT